MEWSRTNNTDKPAMSYIQHPKVSLIAEEYGHPENRGKWGVDVQILESTFRAGDRLKRAFTSREEAEAAAIDLLVKHISDLAAVVGYKVVKEEA